MVFGSVPLLRMLRMKSAEQGNVLGPVPQRGMKIIPA
jgi:hypothetical protein